MLLTNLIIRPPEAKGALAILTGNRALWEDACALWLQVAEGRKDHIAAESSILNLSELIVRWLCCCVRTKLHTLLCCLPAPPPCAPTYPTHTPAYLHTCGECGETSRDLYHSQFGLGGIIQLAEMVSE